MGSRFHFYAVQNIQMFAPQADMRPLTRFRAFRVGKKPLVAGSQPLVLLRPSVEQRTSGIRPPGQNHGDAEPLCPVGKARRIVERGGVNLHHRPGRSVERLHQRSIQHAVPNLIQLGKKQDVGAAANVDLAVPVVFQAV